MQIHHYRVDNSENSPARLPPHHMLLTWKPQHSACTFQMAHEALSICCYSICKEFVFRECALSFRLVAIILNTKRKFCLIHSASELSETSKLAWVSTRIYESGPNLEVHKKSQPVSCFCLEFLKKCFVHFFIYTSSKLPVSAEFMFCFFQNDENYPFQVIFLH